jgi:hypothetical protein
MSKIALSGNPSGTGTLTIASPNTNSDATFNLPTTGGDLLVNGASQAASFSALTVNGNNISATNSLGFRNRIINGDMRIDQRNNGASVSFDTSNKYVTDRFFGFTNVGTTTAQQSSVAPAGFTNSLLVTQATGGSVVAGSFLAVSHRIEGFNAADFGWGTASAQTVTLSFWVRSSVTGAFSVALNNSAFNRSYVANYTISAANTWEQKTVTVPGDTSGTWLTNNGIGIMLYWNLGYGSNFTTSSLNAWIGSGAAGSSTATTAFATTTGATWQITGVQLEAGSVATPFERRPYGTELALCQRYYAKTFLQTTAPAQNAGTDNSIFSRAIVTGQPITAQWKLPVTMRATPTITTFNPTGANANWSANPSSPVVALNSGTEVVSIFGTTNTSAGNGYGIHATAEIEL